MILIKLKEETVSRRGDKWCAILLRSLWDSLRNEQGSGDREQITLQIYLSARRENDAVEWIMKSCLWLLMLFQGRRCIGVSGWVSPNLHVESSLLYIVALEVGVFGDVSRVEPSWMRSTALWEEPRALFALWGYEEMPEVLALTRIKRWWLLMSRILEPWPFWLYRSSVRCTHWAGVWATSFN